VIVSPKTGQKVVCHQLSSNLSFFRDKGNDKIENVKLPNAKEGDMVNIITLENYGRINPVKVRTYGTQ
jgi:hypothetical protein